MKYSQLRKLLIPKESSWTDEGVAAATHYLQCLGEVAADSYERDAKQYGGLIKDSNFDYEISFHYDVPFPPPANPDFRFVDLFAGIGGIRLAFQQQNGKCVFSSEWDKYAKKTYEANYGEVPFGDITEIHANQIPDHDILVAGFPCQPFSLAGVSKKNSLGRSHGFLDKTQGTLFFDICRIIDAKRPSAFLLENVKNLRSHDKGNTFKVIQEALHELGYNVQSKVLDARHYVPQHRERIFIVGFDTKKFSKGVNFNFPEYPDQNQRLAEILEDQVDSKYTLSDKLWRYLQDYARKHREKGNGFGFGLADSEGVSRTLSARYHKDGSEILIPQGNQNPRRLTPKECKRLMGFPEEFRIEGTGVSDTQLYRQFGNSVAVPVVSAVARSMLIAIEQYNELNGSERVLETEDTNN